MTTPNVPLRMEITVEVPGTAEQVWEAIATANGISAWFCRTDMEEREGGVIRFHMGPEMDSEGRVTAFEAPRRIVYEEPDWAELTAHPGAAVTPMVSEFVVEARSGGTCVLRVVSSAFGVGADWEQEFFEDMRKHWKPFFENLRVYLTYFPGQKVTPLEAQASYPGSLEAAWSALRAAIGASEVGKPIDPLGISGEIERVNAPEEPNGMIVRVTDPVPGFFSLGVVDMGGDQGVTAMAQGYFFGAGAPEYVEREQPHWQAWLEQLTVPAA